MIKDLWHILKFKIILFLKLDSNLSFKNSLKSIGSAIVYLLFAYGVYVLSINTFDYLLVNVEIGSFLLHRFILVVLFIFFITINVGNIVVSYSTLYKSKEVNYLITKPISFTKLFLIKFLDNFFYSSTTLLLIITSVLLGYTVYFHLGVLFFLAAFFLLILPFMLTAGSLGAIILLIILKLSSRFGIKKVLSIVFLFYLSSVVAFYFINSPMQLIQKVFDYYPNINQYFGFLENGILKFLPNYWIADSLYWISAGKIARAIPYIYVNVFFSALAFFIALIIAKIWYYQTWLASLNITSELRLKKNFNNTFFALNSKKSSFNTLNESIFKREFWLFFREPSQWIHLTVMLILLIIFITSISGIKSIIFETHNEYLKTVVYLVIMLFNVFLIASLSLRFVFPLISLEGDSFWKLKSAPINLNQLLFKRLVVYLLGIFLIGQTISYYSNHNFPAPLAIFAQINSAIITITLVCMNFGMGGIFANYKEKNAIRLASSQGASITFLFTIFFLIFLILILFIPVYNFFISYSQGISVSIGNLLVSTIMLIVPSSIIIYLTVKSGFKSYNKDF